MPLLPRIQIPKRPYFLHTLYTQYTIRYTLYELRYTQYDLLDLIIPRQEDLVDHNFASII